MPSLSHDAVERLVAPTRIVQKRSGGIMLQSSNRAEVLQMRLQHRCQQASLAIGSNESNAPVRSART